MRQLTRFVSLVACGLGVYALATPVVPQQPRSFVLASTGGNVPQSFLDKDGKLIGIEPDLIAEIARRLGFTYRVEVNTAFSGLVAGMLSGRYDVVSAALADSRQREKVFDFLDYFVTWYVVITRPGNPGHLTVPSEFCGLAMSATDATRPLELLQEQSERCVALGGKPIDIHVHAQSNAAIAELMSGRVVGHVVTGPRANAMLDELPGRIAILPGEPLSREPQGIAFPKKSPLTGPFQEQLNILIKEGFYQNILKKYGLPQGALTLPAQINATGQGATRF